MKKLLFVTLLFILCAFAGDIPQVAGMLGISIEASRKVVNAIADGATIWTVVALVAASGGSAAIAWGLVKSAIVKFGRKVAITW